MRLLSYQSLHAAYEGDDDDVDLDDNYYCFYVVIVVWVVWVVDVFFVDILGFKWGQSRSVHSSISFERQWLCLHANRVWFL